MTEATEIYRIMGWFLRLVWPVPAFIIAAYGVTHIIKTASRKD